jgi:hypothetical protein
MANITGLVPGRLTGTTWATGITTGELGGLAWGSSIMSATPIVNDTGTAYDQLVKISINLVIGSSSLSSGACVAVWIAELLDDGTTYGDGRLTGGTQAAITPSWEPLAVLQASAGSTTFKTGRGGLLLPQANFCFVLQNQLATSTTTGTSITSGTLKYITGNINTSAS